MILPRRCAKCKSTRWNVRGVTDVKRDGGVQQVPGRSLPRRVAASGREGGKGVGSDGKGSLGSRKEKKSDVRGVKRGVSESGRKAKAGSFELEQCEHGRTPGKCLDCIWKAKE